MRDARRLTRAVPAVALVLMLASAMTACGSADTEPTADSAPSSTSSAPAQASSAPPTQSPSPTTPTPAQPSPTASSSSPSESRPSPGDCPQDVRADVERTIREQQDAFAELDFDGARQFATEAFRAIVEPDQFREIIEDQYAFLLTDPRLEFVACVSGGTVVETLVRVESEPRSTLRYRLMLEDAGWRIDGAVIVQTEDDLAA